MINNHQITSDKAEILKEILLSPSQEIVTERFSESNEAADCNGKCSSGICRTFV